MNLTAVTDFLERRIGLDPASLGPSALPAAVADRLRALGLDGPATYADVLAARPDELEALVDRLIVPETWFFRGAGLFDELARQAAAAARPFRALSLPCSTGEEPYSLAMAFLDAGLPPGRWQIDGADLSPRLIAAARRGVYREMSFRQTDPGRRARYFRAVGEGWELDPQVRRHVRFRAGNLLDALLSSGKAAAYDLILCRNLLIYLTPAARRQAVAALERLLVPGGLLAVGPAEPQVLAGRPFRPIGPDAHFLFRHTPAARPHVAPQPPPVVTEPARPLRPVTPPRPPAPATGSLDQARRLADAGRLNEALAECQAHSSHAAPSADACCLLGVIQQARGDQDAADDAFRRALYLDPDHREALAHAMLVAAQRGETDRAAALRARLGRLGPGGEP